MSIDKPYFRITRESVKSSQCFCEYALDNRYADDRGTLCIAYKMIENDMKKIFEYVEPCDDNLQVYSHRIYELFLRSATEFETNCKGILRANDYSKTRNLNVNDYYKINQATKLNEYEVYINIWKPTRKQVRPFEDWEKGHSLGWYGAYNMVKHDRSGCFGKASLDNLLKALAGVYCILFAQFAAYSFTAYQKNNMVISGDDGDLYSWESIFSIKPPCWQENEQYDFDWSKLSDWEEPFQKFNFNEIK